MNKNLKCEVREAVLSVLSVVCLLFSLSAAESARIRVDTRQGMIGGKVGTRVEAVGEPDGSDSSSWATTESVAGVRVYEDGWYVRQTDEYGFKDWYPLAENEKPDHDVLLLNDPVVVGGRLVTNEVWTTGNVHVVRHNVVIPNGLKLVLDPETPVKFTEEARIVVEQGGELVAKGAWLAEIADDEWVGGDTNLDGTNSVPTGTQDWIRGMDPSNYVHVLMLDGAEQVFPTRTYTRGQVYGVLPTMDRYDEGFHFRGWVTNQEETVGVAEDQLAEMSEPALYANWEAIYLNLATGLVEFAAYSVGEEREVGVESNDKWVYSCEADWLQVSGEPSFGSFTSFESFDGSGSITIAAVPNRSELPRSAKVTVSRENGRLMREINVVQRAMEHAAMPQIHTADGGTTFADYMAQVWITCETAGATIYYTTDGSEPSAENGIRLEPTFEYAGGVAGVINVYNSTTIKAIAVRFDLLDSNVTSERLVREATLADAMDIPELYVTTDGDAEWRVVRDVTSDGISAVRSGGLTTSLTKRRYSRLYTHVSGQGTLTFKWKVSCERDITGHCDWDYLGFIADGQLIKRIEGNQDWAEVTYKFTGTGEHVIQWFYTKNAGFADIAPGEDCAWIDQVSWTPAMFAGEGENAREIYVAPSWMMTVGIVGASATDEEMLEAAQADDDGDGFTNEEEGILGTDPKDPNSRLQATIAEKDGLMQVDFSPENKSSGDYNLDYRVVGVTELGGDWKDVTDMSLEDRQALGFKFFKIKVKIQKK